MSCFLLTNFRSGSVTPKSSATDISSPVKGKSEKENETEESSKEVSITGSVSDDKV